MLLTFRFSLYGLAGPHAAEQEGAAEIVIKEHSSQGSLGIEHLGSTSTLYIWWQMFSRSTRSGSQ